MKKKKWLFIGIGIILLVGLGVSFYSYHNYLKEQDKIKKQLKLEEDTTLKYQYFAKNETSEESDKISLYFNKIIDEENKDKNININTFVSNNINLDNLIYDDVIKNIDNEINNYNTDIFNNFNEQELNKLINSSVDKDTVINIYKNNDYIKNIENYKEKRNDYIKSLNEFKSYIEFLKGNKDKYTLKNKIFIYKNDDVKKRLEEFKNKYNLDFEIKKEEIVEVKEETSGVPILCYHGVLDVPWGQASLFVKVNEFEAQMKYLSENGYTTIFASDIKNANKYKKPIVITFDDGYRDVYTNAFPILKKYNLKANVYMISGWINGDVYMTEEMTKEMANSPLIEIGSHTVNHKALATLSDSEIETELKDSKSTLEKMVNKNIDVIAYPTGSYDSRVLNIAEKYYKYGLSTNRGKENPNNLNTYKLNRIYVYRSYNLNQFINAF